MNLEDVRVIRNTFVVFVMRGKGGKPRGVTLGLEGRGELNTPAP